ncbi:MAG: diguanylate cyclase [Candidatus Marinarcus sp.]|uniref:GGDEF domain-containing response regulator n=1 Tax=Candidatus Marinarcus sp. TaxID=3100987 RepID=UPI003B0047D1
MINKKILQNIKVLYVEDEEDVRNFTAKTIKAIVKDIVVAENGLDGLEKFKQNQQIDLIVTDINMPKMGGLEMCEAIQKINPNIPIVITSAHNDPDFLKKAIDIGVDAYAMKPVDLYQLLDCMVKAIEPIFLRRELEALNFSLENKVEEGIKKIKRILDAQDNMVVVSNGKSINHVNQTFLDFFNVSSKEEFFRTHHCISTLFQQDEHFFSNDLLDCGESWITHLQNTHELKRVVKIKNQNNTDRIFTINIHEYDDNGLYYVISLTDITEIKQKSNLLEYQAHHDQLTGLFNRQKFHSIFTKEIRRNRRYSNPLSLIIFDIDDFKDINDTFGHEEGDYVLKVITKITTTAVRDSDTVVRWGGEEFIVLLPETALDNACVVAEKIRASMASFTMDNINKIVTASFGVAQLQESDCETSFIKRADNALYKAKSQGKNRVIKI